MKIGLMTWYTYRNFGTALQATALYHELEMQGHEVKLIRYIPSARSSFFPKLNLNAIAEQLRLSDANNVVHHTIISEQREKMFDKYLRDRIKETKECNTTAELQTLNEEFDTFICGSDGIWAPYLFDERYYLSFAEGGKRIIAYAPSFAVEKVLNEDIKILMRRELSRFTALSVRERDGANVVKEIMGKPAPVVIDPTLLMSDEEWDVYAKTDQVERIRSKYILCYFLNESRIYWNYVQKIAKRLSLPVKLIQITDEMISEQDRIPFEVGPSEFVSLIKHAEYVCTDSFHGLCFSLIYKRPFTVFKRFKEDDLRNINSRVTNILKIFGFEDNLIDPFVPYTSQACSLLHSGDFGKVDDIFKKERSFAKEYLRCALSGKETDKREYVISQTCCGCGACAAVCERKAVQIIMDQEGFEQCKVDENLCIQCGKCRDVCPMYQPRTIPLKNARGLYAIKSTDKKVLERSSSGGIGFELAQSLNANGYYVAGCEYDRKERKAKHKVIAPMNNSELINFQGSKYMQSSSYKAMEELYHLDHDENIVFFGTPCQVAAYDKILRKQHRRDKALLIDLICYGVPTYYLWKVYLDQRRKKNGVGNCPEVEFRSKDGGWRRRVISITGNGNNYRNVENKDDYYSIFKNNLCNMKSCYDCPYREKSAADIRIGDYWGERYESDDTGVSMVISVTEEGEKQIVHLAKDGKIWLEETDLGEYWSVQYPYNPKKPVFRERLIRELGDEKKELFDIRKIYSKPFENEEKLYRILLSVKALKEEL